ncbi:MAG: type II secretion system F family protein [Armatimonadota bacterium]
MPTFRYTARDSAGRLVQDTLVVNDPVSLRATLRASDLYLVKYAETRRRGGARGRIKVQDMLVMTRQLRTMVQAGMPLVTGLETLSTQSNNLRLREVMAQVTRSVSGGRSLADSMEEQKGVFPEILLTLVRSGEEGGRLPESLREAAHQIDLQLQVRQKVVNASIYPVFTLVATFGVLVAMLVWIVPVFGNIYKELKTDLPAPTQMLIDLSALLRKYSLIFLLALGGAILLFLKWAATADGRLVIDRFKLRIPLLNDLFIKAAVAGLAGSLAGLLESGVPLIQGLRSAAAVSGNQVLADSVNQAAIGVSSGRRLSDELERTGYFPRMVVGMISISEDVGTLPEVLRQVAEAYQEELEHALRRIVAVMEPAMILFAGAIVGFVLVALYYPIFMLPNAMMKGG